METGHLERVEREGKPVVYMGQIELPQITGDIALIPHAAKRSESSPDYAVKIRTPGRDYMPSGNAWVKKFKSQAGNFFSITVDNPGMAAPVYVSAFPDDDQPKDAKHPSFFTIQWGRPRRGAGLPEADPAGDAVTTDEIPY